MRLKFGVNATGVEPNVYIWLGAVSRSHRGWTDKELVVTSLRRSPGDHPSWHAPKENELVRAVDFRRWYLDEDKRAEAFCRMLQARYGKGLKVVLEPEWLTDEEVERRGGLLNIDPHVHLELRSVEWPTGIL